MDKKVVTLHIRVSEDVADALKRLADADARKLSPFAALILSRYVVEHADELPPKSGKRSKGGPN
jgi:hypothetical protein